MLLITCQTENTKYISQAEFTLLCGDLNGILDYALLERIVAVQKERLSFVQFKRYRELARQRWKLLK